MRFRKVINPFYVYRNRELVRPALASRKRRLVSAGFRPLRRHGLALSINDRNLLALKDRHRGQRCFIIGSGPSLELGDLDRLQGEVTFACNKIYLAFEETDWRPTYYSVTDVLVAENNQKMISDLRLTKVFEEQIKPYFGKREATWVPSLKNPVENGQRQSKFSTNALEGVYGGWTVLFFQMQLAFYMGIRDIYLIGLDFSFDVPPTTGDSCSSGEILKSRGEVNHFHPDYRKPGETWTMPLLEKQRNAFREARQVVEAHGGRVLNASRKTKLDVLPRIELDSLLGRDHL